MTAQNSVVVDIAAVDEASYVERYAKTCPSRPMKANDAWAFAVGDAVGITVREVMACGRSIFEVHSGDSLSADAIRRLIGMTFIQNGRTFTFSSMEPRSETYDFYGHMTTENWNEFTYQVVE